MGIIVLCWTLSQAAARIRRFLYDLPFGIRMTIGSVVLMASTATGAIEALAISSIYSDFFPDVLLDMLGHWCRDQWGKGQELHFF